MPTRETKGFTTTNGRSVGQWYATRKEAETVAYKRNMTGGNESVRELTYYQWRDKRNMPTSDHWFFK